MSFLRANHISSDQRDKVFEKKLEGDFRFADFSNSTLSEIDLSHALLKDACFYKADVGGAYWNKLPDNRPVAAPLLTESVNIVSRMVALYTIKEIVDEQALDIHNSTAQKNLYECLIGEWGLFEQLYSMIIHQLSLAAFHSLAHSSAHAVTRTLEQYGDRAVGKVLAEILGNKDIANDKLRTYLAAFDSDMPALLWPSLMPHGLAGQFLAVGEGYLHHYINRQYTDPVGERFREKGKALWLDIEDPWVQMSVQDNPDFTMKADYIDRLVGSTVGLRDMIHNFMHIKQGYEHARNIISIENPNILDLNVSSGGSVHNSAGSATILQDCINHMIEKLEQSYQLLSILSDKVTPLEQASINIYGDAKPKHINRLVFEGVHSVCGNRDYAEKCATMVEEKISRHHQGDFVDWTAPATHWQEWLGYINQHNPDSIRKMTYPLLGQGFLGGLIHKKQNLSLVFALSAYGAHGLMASLPSVLEQGLHAINYHPRPPLI
ncbi:MAG: pentapeptide repeat-containing protein [Alphaproteobacteria bacterium]